MYSTTSLGLFDELAATGDHLLKVLAGPAPLGPNFLYIDVLARVCEILAHVHDGIIDVTVAIGTSGDLAEALVELDRINQQGLKQTLHAQLLCDELGSLGRQLTPILAANSALSAQEISAWAVLSQQLEGREEEVAQLYDESLYELKLLPATANNLEDVQHKVEEFAAALAVQKAQFDLIAKKARALHGKLQPSSR